MSFLQLHEYPALGDKYIGHCILNKPEKINVLDAEIVEQLLEALICWQDRDNIAFVLLSGAGDKGFCAGGDIKFMYHLAKESRYTEVNTFFHKEYQLDLLIHQYKKPIIGWGHGIIMGGGMGLFQGCDIRIIEPSTIMAMPEAHIGLFPDVGSGFFAKKMPNSLGKFMLLTAMQLNDGDILYSNLADVCLKEKSLNDFIEVCKTLNFSDINKTKAVRLIESNLQCLHGLPANQSILKQNIESISLLLQSKNILEFETFLLSKKNESDFWSAIYQSYFYGSPFTHAVIWQQWLHYELLDINGALKQDEIIASNVIKTDDFLEGVRALIIDKDKSPNWQFKKIENVDDDKVSSMFV